MLFRPVLVLGILLTSLAFAEDPLPPSAESEPAVETSAPQSAEVEPATAETTTPSPASETPEKPRPKFSLNADTEALKLTDDIKVVRRQLAKNRMDPEANFLAAAAYSRTPNLAKAFDYIKNTKKILKAQKDFEFVDRTIGEYENLLQSRPNDPVILYRLAFGYYFKGYSMERYAEHYKNRPTGSADEFYDKARQTMQKVIELTPNDIWARNYLGYFMSDNGKDLSKAISVWKESIAIDSEHNAGAYLLLSQAYLKQGDLQNALVFGAKGLEIQQRMGMTLP